MDKKEALRIFEETGALRQGHFELTSGLHSTQYFQCAMVLQYPQYLQIFAEEIVEFYQDEEVDVVISPAIGGIVVGQEVARQLNARSIFTERENGKMTLRRGFDFRSHEKILICEDVITTGGSVKEIIEIIDAVNAYPVGVGVVVDRSDGSIDFNMPLVSAVQVKAITYKAKDCPLCLEKVPVTRPGSRSMK